MFLAEFIGKLVPFFFGAWFFVFSRVFREKAFETWHSRSGLAHLRTALEIVVAAAVGFFPATVLIVVLVVGALSR